MNNVDLLIKYIKKIDIWEYNPGKMKLLLLFFLFLIALIIPFKSENKKLEQKSFDKIFGEKWEEKEQKMQIEHKKREIIRKYFQIKDKIKQKGRKYSAKEWNKINTKIAKSLGTNRKYIYEWINEFGLQKQIKKSHKSKSDEQKIEIVQKFIEMTKEFKQNGRKYSTKEWDQNYGKICKKIGVSLPVIKKWKNEFGISNKRITMKEKMEKIKIYWQIKREIPKIRDQKIAEMINISAKNICKWKEIFGEENFEF